MTHSTLRTAIVGFVLCVAASTTACSSNSGKDIVTQGSDVVTTQGDGSITVEQLISALQGGTLEIPGGARLEIPPGALAEDTTVSVTVPTDQKASTSHVIFLLEPQGLTFKHKALDDLDAACPKTFTAQYKTILDGRSRRSHSEWFIAVFPGKAAQAADDSRNSGDVTRNAIDQPHGFIVVRHRTLKTL